MFLQTQRLVLRAFAEGDLDTFVSYRNEPEVAKFQGWNIPYTREQAGHFFDSIKNMDAPKQGDWLQVAIALKDSNELIGDLGCFIKQEDARQAIIGFTLASKFWGKGYATEAVLCWLGYLFNDLDIHRVTADCDTENTASFRLLERIGFRREAHFVESYPVDGGYTSEYHYGLLQREWHANFKAGS